MTTRKTYWHLQALGCKPDEYDIGSSRLLYHPQQGYEVAVPLQAWQEQYLTASRLQCSDWERFEDPRRTTYRKYTELQTVQEAFLDGLFKAIEETRYDAGLSASWLAVLERVLPVLRFPAHGLQMVSAYLAHLAPSGKLVIAGLFQAADELRRVQRLAQRMGQLRKLHKTFGDDSRSQWQSDPIWQPLRELLEQLLTTYDWSEALVAHQLVCKPMFDELFMTHFGRVAEHAGDSLLGKLFFSLNEDCQWQRACSRQLVDLLLQDQPANAQIISSYLDRWQPRARAAAAAFTPLMDAAGVGVGANGGKAAIAELETFRLAYLRSMGLA